MSVLNFGWAALEKTNYFGAGRIVIYRITVSTARGMVSYGIARSRLVSVSSLPVWPSLGVERSGAAQRGDRLG